jgi:26S proteasome regulatory subunit N12
MPAAMTSHPPALDSILHTLQQSLSHNDPSQAKSQLQKAKLALLQHNALIPSQQTPAQTLATARSILEAGALLSIRSRDPESFIRYYSQLQPFYDFPGLQQHPSRERSKITGLYLLLLLSNSDYAGFHTLLESLIVSEGADGSAVVEEDPFIKYPVELERSLMEGSYDQVWRKTSGRDVPGEEFGLFSDVSGDLQIAADSRRLTGCPDPNQHHPH